MPRDGAVVLASFETDQGRSVILNMSRNDGKALPFGAEIYENDVQIGNMGQADRLLFAVSAMRANSQYVGLKKTSQ